MSGQDDSLKPSFGDRVRDIPDYGAYFLALTWLVFRVIAVFAMLTVIGALGFTIGAFDQAAIEPPALLVKGIIVVSRIRLDSCYSS